MVLTNGIGEGRGSILEQAVAVAVAVTAAAAVAVAVAAAAAAAAAAAVAVAVVCSLQSLCTACQVLRLPDIAHLI